MAVSTEEAGGPVPDLAARPPEPAELLARYESATAQLEPPFAIVDLDALWWNGADMLRRAAGKPLRVASKSLRVRPLLRTILDRRPETLGFPDSPGFRGLMTFTLPETLWLYESGFEDLLVAYPTTDRTALSRLAETSGAGRPIVMVDSVEHLDLIESATRSGPNPVRVCVEMDMSFPVARGRLRIGPKRSPLRTPGDVAALAAEVVRRRGFELSALMGYEGHIAGLGDAPAAAARALAIRRMQSASVREIADRRAAIVAAVTALAPVEIVNGGGTGSVHTTAREDCVTEITVGSGFYAPGLFDDYTSFALRPAAMFAIPVVRRSDPRHVTLLGGGYPASGAAGKDRLPEPYLPAGLKLDPFEGVGEVQTPVSGQAAKGLGLGDRVYLRHAKAGELCERFDRLYAIAGDAVVDELPTYRGEGKTFL